MPINSDPSEERFPLLLLFLEDGQRSTKRPKRVLFDKSRYQQIASGTSAVITQWPEHLTSCWLTSMIIGLTIILLTMTIVGLSMKSGTDILVARCRNKHSYDNYQFNPNQIIHLVHGIRPWHQCQLDSLRKIAETFQGKADINLIIIQNQINFIDRGGSNLRTQTQQEVIAKDKNDKPQKFERNGTILKRTERFKRLTPDENKETNIKNPRGKIQLKINIGTKKLLKMLLNRKYLGNKLLHKRNPKTDEASSIPATTTVNPKIRTLQELLKIYPKIRVTNTTYEEFFKHSPLHYYWQNMNEITRLFSIRVLRIWNFGGITFDLPELDDISVKFTTNIVEGSTEIRRTIIGDDKAKYEGLIKIGLASYENLPDGLVTIDNMGLHMETKTICHAFFGEILMNLRKATIDTMPEDVISNALQKFCRTGVVDADYCKKNTN